MVRCSAICSIDARSRAMSTSAKCYRRSSIASRRSRAKVRRLYTTLAMVKHSRGSTTHIAAQYKLLLLPITMIGRVILCAFRLYTKRKRWAMTMLVCYQS